MRSPLARQGWSGFAERNRRTRRNQTTLRSDIREMQRGSALQVRACARTSRTRCRFAAPLHHYRRVCMCATRWRSSLQGRRRRFARRRLYFKMS
jgi:hypothetical protein